MELSLVNIQLQYKEDWDLVNGAIEFSLLVVLNLFKSNLHDARVHFEKMEEERSPLEDLELGSMLADEELKKQFRNH